MKTHIIINEEMNDHFSSLTESPDRVIIDDDKELWYYHDDAITFGFAKANNTLYAEKGKIHVALAKKYGLGKTRYDFYYAGRLWLDSKIISFWDYPPKNNFFDLIKELENKLNVKILNNNWLVEVYEDTYEGKSILIPVEKYMGEYYNPYEDEEYDLYYSDRTKWNKKYDSHRDREHEKRFEPDHVLPPMKKKEKKPSYDKYKKYKIIPAQYRFHKEKNVAEEIIREEINLFINEINSLNNF